MLAPLIQFLPWCCIELFDSGPNVPENIPVLSTEKEARVRAVIENNPAYRADPSHNLKVTDDLATSINHVYVDKAHRKRGSDPYQTPAKIAQLSYLLGHNTAFNCKSGKDRSDQMVAKIKTLAA